MSRPISTREQRLIGIAVVAVVLVVGWIYLLDPQLEKNRATTELIFTRQELLAKRKELVARRPALTQELQETARELEAVTDRLLTAATPAVAASELQKFVKDVASQAGLEVRSERILPPTERGDLLEIPVEIAVAGNIRALVGMLHGLEGSSKLLTVQDVKIRVVSAGAPKELLTSLTLAAFILSKPLSVKAS